MDQNVCKRFCLFPADRMQRIHCELEFAVGKFLDQENDGRNDNGNDTDRSRKIFVCSSFTNELIIDFDREGPIAFANHQRSAEVGKCTHENHQGCRKNGRHTQRDADLPETLEAGAAEICRRFQQGIVDILHRTGNVHKRQWEKPGRHCQKDAAEAINAGDFYIECGFQESCNDAIISKEKDPCVGANKRGGHRAEDDNHLEQLSPVNFIDVVKVCERNAKNKGYGSRSNGNLEAVPKRRNIVFLREKCNEVFQRKLSIFYNRSSQNIKHRVDQKQ